MSTFNSAVANAVAEAAKNTDMTKATKGGGGYTPPAKGLARLRFVGYIECGKHEDTYDGRTKIKEKVKLIFELSGPKHQPRESEDGTKIPHRITVEENLSLNEKAWFYKIFRAMNYQEDATHIAQLLGNEYLGEIVHKTSRSGNVYAVLKNDVGYTIRAPFVEDPETGETRKVPAGPQLSEIRCFLWDYASQEMWDSIFIEGEYEAEKDEEGNITRPARSKNVFQDKIRSAVNFEESPIAEILADASLSVPNAERVEPAPEEDAPKVDETDPLAGIE